MSATDPKADIIATAQIAPKGDVGRSVYGWLRKELGSARADSAMLVDPAGASRENARRDGSLTCPGPRLCLGASHLYAGGCTPIGTTPRYDDDCASLAISPAGIVPGIQVFEAQRTNGRYLGDVLTGLCPVEVGRIAGQNDNAPGWIRLHFIAVEMIAQADIENAGHDCVDPVLRVPVWD